MKWFIVLCIVTAIGLIVFGTCSWYAGPGRRASLTYGFIDHHRDLIESLRANERVLVKPRVDTSATWNFSPEIELTLTGPSMEAVERAIEALEGLDPRLLLHRGVKDQVW